MAILSTKVFCDSCGEEITEKNPSAVGVYPINGVVDALGVHAVNGHDICRTCLVKYIGGATARERPRDVPVEAVDVAAAKETVG